MLRKPFSENDLFRVMQQTTGCFLLGQERRQASLQIIEGKGLRKPGNF
jgi:hypothetical protein